MGAVPDRTQQLEYATFLGVHYAGWDDVLKADSNEPGRSAPNSAREGPGLDRGEGTLAVLFVQADREPDQGTG